MLCVCAALAFTAWPLADNALAYLEEIPGSATLGDPASGPPGTSITIKGSGLTPGKTYSPRFTGAGGGFERIGPNVTADAAGKATAYGTAPNLPPQQGHVTLYEEDTCDYSVPANFLLEQGMPITTFASPIAMNSGALATWG